MDSSFRKRSVITVGIYCLIAVVIGGQAVFAVEGQTAVQAGYKQGLVHYENNQIDKALASFKDALAAAFPQPASGKLQDAVSLAQSGKADEAEKNLLSLFEEDATAARARYELGRIYEAQGKLDKAAVLFRNALATISSEGAKYVGVKSCKMCHFKQYKTWKKTRMAKTFEVLKPGANAESKAKLKFDPQKDYTKDPLCLSCHTTGFGLPGGYKIPKDGDSKAVKAAKANEGTTCEACHGPGSKYIAIHKTIMSKKSYTPQELFQAGQYKVSAGVCTTCHNRRNPMAGPDYRFDYEKSKDEDTHEKVPLKYRAK